MRTDGVASTDRFVRLKPAIRSVFLAFAAVIAGAHPALTAAQAAEPSWVGTWMASPQPVWGSDFTLPTNIPASVKDQTIRQVARISLGGSRIRLVFSNAYGDDPLRIGGASVGLAGEDGANEHVKLRRTTHRAIVSQSK